MDITIRQAVEKDALSLLPLMEQLGYKISETDLLENIQLHLTSGYNLFVAEAHGKLVGFISIHIYRYLHLKNSLSRITALCIDAERRSFGIGARLLAYAEEYIKSEGCKLIELTSGIQREDAHRFYERQGYVEKRKRFVKEI
ncbi:MAG TPA: GNAT family N-acetyltransferase [Chitinophagaceae bacterium]|nr:GNAT family N-acetyltransferase [Chitinophagaceae bacterium]